MKKALCIILALVMVLALAACGSTPADNTPAASTPSASTPSTPDAPSTPDEPEEPESKYADFPKENINIIVPHKTGTGYDILARKIAEGMSENLGVNVYVTNITDGAGAEGWLAGYEAEADGYTIVFSGFPDQYVGQLIYDRPYDISEMTPLVALTESGDCFMVPADFPYDTLEDTIAACLNGEIELVCGDSGAGGSTHLESLAFKQILGLDMRHVHFSAVAEVITSWERDETNCLLIGTGSAPSYAAAGDVKILSVNELTNDSLADLTDAPALGDVPGVTAEQAAAIIAAVTGYRTFIAPPGMDPELADILAQAIIDVAGSDEYIEWAASAGHTIIINSGDDLAAKFDAAVAVQMDLLETYKDGIAS